MFKTNKKNSIKRKYFRLSKFVCEYISTHKIYCIQKKTQICLHSYAVTHKRGAYIISLYFITRNDSKRFTLERRKYYWMCQGQPTVKFAWILSILYFYINIIYVFLLLDFPRK